MLTSDVFVCMTMKKITKHTRNGLHIPIKSIQLCLLIDSRQRPGWGTLNLIPPLKDSKFKFSEECKYTDTVTPKAALFSFRSSAHTFTETTVVQVITGSVVHMVQELNTIYGPNTLNFGNKWPVGSRKVFRIKTVHT